LRSSDNAIALFNELMVSAYLYLMMSLTDFQGEIFVRSEIGYVLLLLVVLTVLVNFFKALWFMVMGLKCTKKMLYKIKSRQTTACHPTSTTLIHPPQTQSPAKDDHKYS
jgi:predicted membrane protein